MKVYFLGYYVCGVYRNFVYTKSGVQVPAGGGGFGSSSANAGITMADRANSFAAMEVNQSLNLDGIFVVY